MLTLDYIFRLLKPFLGVAAVLVFVAAASLFAYRFAHTDPSAARPEPPHRLTIAELRVEATRILAERHLTWKGLADQYIRDDRLARDFAHDVYENHISRAREEELDAIRKGIVDPYYSLGPAYRREAGCLIRLIFGHCEEYLTEDFKQKFRGIDDTALVQAWQRGAEAALQVYDERYQELVGKFYSEHAISKQQSEIILRSLDIRPFGSATQFASKLGLYQNQMDGAVRFGLGTFVLARSVGDAIHDNSLKLARTAIMDRAGKTLSANAPSAVERKVLRKVVVKTAAKAVMEFVEKVTIFEAIIVEYVAYLDRLRDADQMMGLFRSEILKNEERYLDRVIECAREASVNTDIPAAMLRLPVAVPGTKK